MKNSRRSTVDRSKALRRSNVRKSSMNSPKARDLSSFTSKFLKRDSAIAVSTDAMSSSREAVFRTSRSSLSCSFPPWSTSWALKMSCATASRSGSARSSKVRRRISGSIFRVVIGLAPSSATLAKLADALRSARAEAPNAGGRRATELVDLAEFTADIGTGTCPGAMVRAAASCIGLAPMPPPPPSLPRSAPAEAEAESPSCFRAAALEKQPL
mmetsp:Transcript_122023/g.390167  ORF Transcript_122023/g.390167 Transcript_122023/m.390167 type:complete len:213 (+) Transcript_122023:1548-2186(+)